MALPPPQNVIPDLSELLKQLIPQCQDIITTLERDIASLPDNKDFDYAFYLWQESEKFKDLKNAAQILLDKLAITPTDYEPCEVEGFSHFRKLFLDAMTGDECGFFANMKHVACECPYLQPHSESTVESCDPVDPTWLIDDADSTRVIDDDVFSVLDRVDPLCLIEDDLSRLSLT